MNLILRTAVALIVAVTAIGCTKSDSADPAGGSAGTASSGAKAKLKVGIVFDSGGRGDKSFNDSADRGLTRAAKELGIEPFTVESQNDSQYEGNLSALADKGCDLIIAVGIGMQKAVENVAPQYNDTKFAIVDAVVEKPNVSCLLFKEEEGSFLAGYLAGLMSKSGKIGFVGGKQIPLIEKFYAGYAAGAKSAKPTIEILPEKYAGSWNDTNAGKANANILYAAGADIVYHAAGRAGLGVFAAAKEANKYAIGVDSDQDEVEKGLVLTSMIKRVDEAVYQTIVSLQSGAFKAGNQVFDLKAGGVGLSEMKFTKELVGQDNLKKIEEIAAKISDGAIKVPSSKAELESFAK